MSEKRLLRVLAGEQVWPPPVWLMRQAGRFLPEFRALRRERDFLTRCMTPDIATEITLQPIRRFGMDGTILFSDILVLPWMMGQPLRFAEGEGPLMEPIRDAAALEALRLERVAEAAAPIMETIRRTRAALATLCPSSTLIGFAGSPFTVACYMVEGSGSRDFVRPRRMAYEAPDVFDRLLALLVEATVFYLSLQIEAGAEVAMLFDSWAGILPPDLFERAVIAPTAGIVARLKAAHPTVPVIGFPRLGGLHLAPYVERTGVNGVGLDNTMPPALARAAVPARVAVQGSLDPVRLLVGGEGLRDEAAAIAHAFRGRPHIFNLGHGVLPDTPVSHVEALVEQVRSL